VLGAASMGTAAVNSILLKCSYGHILLVASDRASLRTAYDQLGQHVSSLGQMPF
jgi:hypothetical protein